MNRYLMIHYLRWPAVILLLGTLALLRQLDVISCFWCWFWPLLLIMIGVLMLVERAALAMMNHDLDRDDNGAWPYGGKPASTATQPETSIIRSGDFGQHGNGETQ
jgi:hypothetical protein